MPSDTSPSSYPVAVDLVALTIRNERLHVLVIERGVTPHRGDPALPGGFVRPEESLEAAAERELLEETGIDVRRFHLEQLGTYGNPGRDPRGRVIAVAYIVLLPNAPEPTAGSDAESARWSATVGLDRTTLAFDHGRILSDAVERARSKLEYTTLATTFCPEEFTIAELRAVYEAVWGRPVDPRNFHRKVQASPGFVEPTGRRTNRGGGRPAELYRSGSARLINPPMTR